MRQHCHPSLCLKLKLNKHQSNIYFGFPAMFVLCPENSLKQDVKLNTDTLSFESIQGKSGKVQINTHPPYVGYGGGKFVLTDVKRLSAKDDFPKMSLKDRNCKVKLNEDCIHVRQEISWKNAAVFP